MKQPLWIALIPAYEPDTFLLKLVQELKKSGFEVLVVDDGSSQGKKDIFQKFTDEAIVLTHSKNKGKGSAIKTGLFYIQSNVSGYYITITVDADGQHSPEDVKKVCIEAQKHPGCLVLGSRKIQKNTPLKSRFGNQITRMVYAFTTGIKIYDTQTGLRAFDNTLILELLEVPGERYEYEMNVLLECSRKKIPMKETEIETIYINENAGSHFHPWKDSCRIYKEILKFSAASFVSFLLDYVMYSLILLFTAGLSRSTSLLAANVGARIISAGFNFKVNQKLVFQSDENTLKSALEYVVLAVGILIGNTMVLELMVNLGMNQYLGKLCTELLFFLSSWIIQRKVIFKSKGDVTNG